MSDSKDEPVIYDPQFWKERADFAVEKGEIHWSILHAPERQFLEHAKGSKEFLANHIHIEDSVLDIGCGYGRFFDVFPEHKGPYLGIDISPDLIYHARKLHPTKQFEVADIRSFSHEPVDWVVAIGIKNMICNYVSEESWNEIEIKYRKLAVKGLIIIFIPLSQPPYVLTPL